MLMQTSGLGGMEVNTVVIPWREEKKEGTAIQFHTAQDFVKVLVNAVVIKKNVVVTRHTQRLDARLLFKKSKEFQTENLNVKSQELVRGVETIDVWITGAWDTPGVNASAALMLQLAYVLYSNKEWRRRTRIRLIKGCESTSSVILQQERLRLAKTASELRIEEYVDEILVISTSSSIVAIDGGTRSSTSTTDVFADDSSLVEINQTLQRHSIRTAQLILMLPDPRHWIGNDDMATTYLTKLNVLTSNLPSTMLIFSDDEADSVISTSI